MSSAQIIKKYSVLILATPNPILSKGLGVFRQFSVFSETVLFKLTEEFHLFHCVKIAWKDLGTTISNSLLREDLIGQPKLIDQI